MTDYLKYTDEVSRRRAREEAARWFAKLNSPACCGEMEDQFRHWLEESPLNALAYEQCKTIWLMAGDLKDDKDIQKEIIQARQAAGTGQKQGLWSAGKQWFAGQRLVQFAAMALLTAGVVFFITHMPANQFSTKIGEQRLVRLPDGSTAMLNTDTVIVTTFNNSRRGIELRQGEAYFDVVKDPSRPFEVQVSDSVVRAVGTEFNVALKDAEVSVAVVEGIVEVEADDRNNHTSQVIAEIKHGQAVKYQKGETAPKIEVANLERISAWQVRKVYFKSDRLVDAVAEYNRYSEREIEIFGDQLKEQLITGIFNIGDIESFVFSLEQALDVHVVRKKDRILVMQKSASIQAANDQG